MMSVSSICFRFIENQGNRIAYGNIGGSAAPYSNCERFKGIVLLIPCIGAFIAGSLLWFLSGVYNLCNRCCCPPQNYAAAGSQSVTRVAHQALPSSASSAALATAPVSSVASIVSPPPSVEDYHYFAQCINRFAYENPILLPDGSISELKDYIERYAIVWGNLNIKLFHWKDPIRQIPPEINLFTQLDGISADHIRELPDISQCGRLQTLNILSDNLQRLPTLIPLVSLETLVLQRTFSEESEEALFPDGVMRPIIDLLRNRLSTGNPLRLSIRKTFISKAHCQALENLIRRHPSKSVILNLW